MKDEKRAAWRKRAAEAAANDPKAVNVKALRWWTSGNDGFHWWLQYQPGLDKPIGEVHYVMKGSENDGWDATVRGEVIGTFPTCRRAKLAVRRAVLAKGKCT